jgi:rSAM/selenodomain-associated transferase 2
MQISIIIPTLNEAARIEGLLVHLSQFQNPDLLAEILVVDGGSKDSTQTLAKEAGAKVLRSPRPGRAVQMNHGARHAKGEILYFVHADVIPPRDCLSAIRESVTAGHAMGGFAYLFDSASPLLRFNSFFTQFDWMANGGGDQTLFIQRESFEEMGGFDEELPIMEDFDFVWRAKKKYGFKLIKSRVIVSARKYEQNSWLRVQLVNATTFLGFRWGVPPERLTKWYAKMLHRSQ